MSQLLDRILKSLRHLGRKAPAARQTKEQTLLRATVLRAIDTRRAISRSFSAPWTKNPGPNERAVFGTWTNNAVRHLGAVIVLVEQGDLALIAEVHFRQLLELLLQVRRLAQEPTASRDSLALKVAAWGCVDYLKKLEPVKNEPYAAAGYTQLSSMKARFPPALIKQIEAEMKKGKKYWYGVTTTTLANRVSLGHENLAAVFAIASAQAHGSWDVALGVTSPSPGHLDFRPYPDSATLHTWAAETLDRVTEFSVRIWNTIADVVGAPNI